MEMEINLVINAFVTIFSIGLFVISIASYRKYKNTKLLFVSVVFLVLFIKAVLVSLSFFLFKTFSFGDIMNSGIFDLMILMFLFMATLKR
ncbi:MAG: hypothetical protein NT038_09935 [Euryarchaeota archaeon]|nr:hypothetical protein [Euryarchaeota archaeon]